MNVTVQQNRKQHDKFKHLFNMEMITSCTLFGLKEPEDEADYSDKRNKKMVLSSSMDCKDMFYPTLTDYGKTKTLKLPPSCQFRYLCNIQCFGTEFSVQTK